MSLAWLIIGGGIHGVHIGARLIDTGVIAKEQLRILDPAPDLLMRWRDCTSRVGMKYLRSPSVHQLGNDPLALQRFAGSRKNRKPGRFAAPYNRPDLALFNAHNEHVVQRSGLRSLHSRGRAETCLIGSDGVTVKSDTGQVWVAERVVLALGMGDQLTWPSWAPQNTSSIQHIFQPDCDLETEVSRSVAVVGGGISAAQVALRLAKQGCQVQLILRHPLREHQFDSDPGWLGPKHMASFEREPSMERRRVMITNARHRGSVPPDVHRALSTAFAQGTVIRHEANVETLQREQDSLVLHLSNGVQVSVDRVLLATGFAPQRPGGPMLDRLIHEACLPCAPCGYPIVDAALRWHPRIHVTGPLAELELGPTARNIAGAQRAADRILASLAPSDSSRYGQLSGDTANGGFSAPQPIPRP